MSELRPVALRGHHLLCLFGFRGFGYTPRFTANMAGIVKAVRETGRPIVIRSGPDSICRACPHLGPGICTRSAGSEARVQALDARVLRQLGLQPGSKLDADQLAALVARRVDPADLDRLCRGCSWLSNGFCRAGLAMLKRDQNSEGETS